nr:hypothetical protein [Nonomuraea mesophila]
MINTGGEKGLPAGGRERAARPPGRERLCRGGRPGRDVGERVSAVVATPDGTLTERELQDWVRRGLAGYKVPRAIVLLPALRRTPTGKLEVAWARRVIEQAAGRTGASISRSLPARQGRRG